MVRSIVFQTLAFKNFLLTIAQVLRELIQNADDAEARCIEVHFRTGEVEKSQPAGGFDVCRLNVSSYFGQGFGSTLTSC